MPALLIAFVIVAGMQPGWAGGQDRDSSQDELEGRREELAPGPTLGDLYMEAFEHFRLYTGCSPLRLLVLEAGDDAEAIGLTKDRLQAAAESRLRSSRLYLSPETKLPKATDPPTLAVSAEVVGSAFLVQVELLKTLSDPASGSKFDAGTWESGSLGTHGGNSGYIVQLVAEELDKFLVEYLRVNDKDCPR